MYSVSTDTDISLTIFHEKKLAGFIPLYVISTAIYFKKDNNFIDHLVDTYQKQTKNRLNF